MLYNKPKYTKHNLAINLSKEQRKEKYNLGGYYRGRNFTYDLSSWNDNDGYGYGKE